PPPLPAPPSETKANTPVAIAPPPLPIPPSMPPAPRSEPSRPMAVAPSQPPTPSVQPDKAKAQQLLADARRLQKEGRLAEARQKPVTAQKLGASFGLSEDRPELALLDLAALTDKRIDSLKHQANDHLQVAATDPNRFPKAEANLLEARQLAIAFGFDTKELD